MDINGIIAGTSKIVNYFHCEIYFVFCYWMIDCNCGWVIRLKMNSSYDDVFVQLFVEVFILFENECFIELLDSMLKGAVLPTYVWLHYFIIIKCLAYLTDHLFSLNLSELMDDTVFSGKFPFSSFDFWFRYVLLRLKINFIWD